MNAVPGVSGGDGGHRGRHRQGRNAGLIEGVLAALGIPYESIRPAKWKPAMGLPKGALKDASRARAMALFPALAERLSRKKDDGRAEALLLAEWRARLDRPACGAGRMSDHEESHVLNFFVPGKPEPQGSARAFVAKGKPVVTSDNPEVKSWRGVIATAASTAMGGRPPEHDGPVVVHLSFRMPRPKSYPKTRELPHTKKPDIDKLIRAVLDGLTAVVFRDDSQVAMVSASKRYALGDEPPGAQVTVVCRIARDEEAQG